MGDNTTEAQPSRVRRTTDAAHAGLDVMLSEAATGGTPRFMAPGAALKVSAGLARHPGRAAARAARLTSELRRVASGRSEIEPAKGDRRFTDPAWAHSWLFRRLLQSYLAVGETVDGLIDDSDVDWRAARQARLAAGNVVDALAPTNFPWSNPEVLKETINTGGESLVRGARQLAHDLATPPRLPATVDTRKFEVGRNLATSPGSVVLHTDVFELIQYKPSTEQVREVPLLFVPPTINKYYVLDISPGRSMIEYCVGQGHQVFTISWRNPEQAQGHFDLDTYANAVAQARDAAASITEQSRVHLAAACSGGLVTVGLLGQLAASGELDEVASLTLMVCALDNETEGTMSALASRDVAAAAVAESARKGYLDGQALRACSRGCARTTWCGTTSSTTTCSVRIRPRSTSSSGTRTRCAWPRGCIAISSRSGSTTRSHIPVRSRCSASRSISSASTWIPISSPASPITSSRGRARTTERCCSAAAAVRAVEQRTHPISGQSAACSGRRIPGELSRRRRAARHRGRVSRPGAEAVGKLVVGLGAVADGALG